MKVLITGAAGFVGRHLAADLKAHGHEIILTGLFEETLSDFGPVIKLDITDRDECKKVLSRHMPDAIVHLAGLAHTASHNSDPNLLYQINVSGAVNMASEMSQLTLKSGGHYCSFLFVSSAFVYGGESGTLKLSCSESTPTYPRTKYGESKLIAEYALKFFDDDKLPIYIARPFNHIGTGQDASFAVPAFVSRIRESSDNGTIETGDLTALRDFTDVRDIVRGYRLILEKKPKERTFVFGRGETVTIKSILDEIIALSGKKLSHHVNPALLRESERLEIFAEAKRAEFVLQWRPEISLRKTLQDIWDQCP